MADWKVFREQIKVQPHPNAERLEIGNVGGFPIVFQKGLHEDGKIVIFIPEKSVLPEELQSGFKDYLKGPNKDRVGSIRLRGEPSLGIVIPDREELKSIELGEDLSEKLNIHKFEPPIPLELAGRIKPLGTFSYQYQRHEVEQFTINKTEFVDGEEVICTEKVHGSQLWTLRAADGTRHVSSKGMIKRNWTLDQDDNNAYWKSVNSIRLFDMLDEIYPNKNVQVFGEVIPVQKGFSYGQTNITAKLFDIVVENKHIDIDSIPDELKKHWVPILYRGPFDLTEIMKLKEGKEKVSGKELHIKEGLVIRPIVDRFSSGKNPFKLMLKLLNSKYQEDEEAFS